MIVRGGVVFVSCGVVYSSGVLQGVFQSVTSFVIQTQLFSLLHA